eukprot:GHVR01105179.1.p1 GENE.GHVR01105179.1~~GHVR01105179.1.p1  ORF type:complete len:366 (+),score=108.54 GHVR01105179.1:153-1100(+)
MSGYNEMYRKGKVSVSHRTRSPFVSFTLSPRNININDKIHNFIKNNKNESNRVVNTHTHSHIYTHTHDLNKYDIKRLRRNGPYTPIGGWRLLSNNVTLYFIATIDMAGTRVLSVVDSIEKAKEIKFNADNEWKYTFNNNNNNNNNDDNTAALQLTAPASAFAVAVTIPRFSFCWIHQTQEILLFHLSTLGVEITKDLETFTTRTRCAFDSIQIDHFLPGVIPVMVYTVKCLEATGEEKLWNSVVSQFKGIKCCKRRNKNKNKKLSSVSLDVSIDSAVDVQLIGQDNPASYDIQSSIHNDNIQLNDNNISIKKEVK